MCAVQCCRLDFDDGWRAGWAKPLPFRPFLPSHSLQFIEKKAPRKKKNQQEISGNNDKIMELQ
jgi:hypothetical protein